MGGEAGRDIKVSFCLFISGWLLNPHTDIVALKGDYNRLLNNIEVTKSRMNGIIAQLL